MVFIEIQNKMSSVFDILKILEVKINTCREEFEKSQSTENACCEGVQTLQKKLTECKKSDIISFAVYLDIIKDLKTVEGFLNQSRSNRAFKESLLKQLLQEREKAQSVYDSLNVKLTKAENNVIYITHE